MEKALPTVSVARVLKTYFLLTKPRIIMGNVITAIGGFALGSTSSFNFVSFLITLFGISLVIASACIFNNYIDRDFDKKMERTKHRGFARGDVSASKALFVASLLVLFGTTFLGTFINYLSMILALLGFVVYIFLYSFIKYYSSHGTLIGSIAGAMPPAIGYCAAKGQLDLGAAFIFFLVAFWQMPHFFAIAIYRIEDYKTASIPVLPLKHGIHHTKIQMIAYILIFLAASSLLFFFGYTGPFYLLTTLILSFSWLWLAALGFKAKNDQLWARKMFAFSLVVITILCAVILLESISVSSLQERISNVKIH